MSEAFGTRSASGTWCRIGNGKIIRQAEPTDPQAVKVQKKDGKGNPVMDDKGMPEFRYELHNATVSGRLIGLETKSDTFDNVEIRKLVVTLQHPQVGHIHVQVKEDSRYWNALLQALPNVDLAKEVTLVPWDYVSKQDGKRKIGMKVTQGSDEGLPWAFEQGTIPPAVEHKINNKSVWDFGPVRQFLIEKSLSPTMQKLKGVLPPTPVAQPQQAAPQASVTSDPQAPYQQAPPPTLKDMPPAPEEPGESDLPF